MTKRKIVSLVLILILLCGICSVVAGCKHKPDDFTLEEHIARISRLVDEYFINEDTRMSRYNHVTDYTLYPLYNDNDELRYFLVEFEPYGFAFVSIREEDWSYYGCMYHYNVSYVNDSW